MVQKRVKASDLKGMALLSQSNKMTAWMDIDSDVKYKISQLIPSFKELSPNILLKYGSIDPQLSKPTTYN